MNHTGLVRLTGALTALVAAALVIVEGAPDTTKRRLLVGVCVVLTVVALIARLTLARDRIRQRRAARAAARARRRANPGGTPIVEAVSNRRSVVGIAVALLGVIVGLLAIQGIVGLSFWSLLLLAVGGFVIWSQTADVPEATDDRPLTGWQRLVGRRDGQRSEADRLLLASGVALVVLGALVALSSLGALQTSRTGAVQLIVALGAILVVVAPFWRRMSRRAQAERSERIRGDERAEVAAHLHDSVLQTLALIQRRNNDPREVASLARRQERELRLWLSGRSERPEDELMAGLRAAAAAVELEQGVEIEVVTSGEAPLDDRAVALLAAAREAMANAARHSGVAETGDDSHPISVFAEVEDGTIAVFVRDRGRGFDPDSVPSDRRGVRESIVGRMRRAGGRATIHTSPGEGTEVELLLENRS